MKLTKLNSNYVLNVNITKKKINWDKLSKSKPQKRVKDFFRQYWENKYVCAEEWRVPGSLYKFDLINFNKYLIIEYDGSQHNQFSKFFHGNRMGFLKSLKNDSKKESWAEINCFTVIRLTDEDLPLLSPEYFEEKFGINIL